MGHKGSFDLPVGKEQSTKGARIAYKNMWQRDWPHDDDYLRNLAKVVQSGYLPQHDTSGYGKCGMLLNAMRECHVFPGEEIIHVEYVVPFEDFDYESALPKYQLSGHRTAMRLLIDGTVNNVRKFEADFEGIVRV